jgi:hypothetical protein
VPYRHDAATDDQRQAFLEYRQLYIPLSYDSGDDLVTYADAYDLLGWRDVDALVRLGRHHSDPDGKPYWLADEWDDLVGLIAYERRRKKGGRSCCQHAGPRNHLSSVKGVRLW